MWSVASDELGAVGVRQPLHLRVTGMPSTVAPDGAVPGEPGVQHRPLASVTPDQRPPHPGELRYRPAAESGSDGHVEHPTPTGQPEGACDFHSATTSYRVVPALDRTSGGRTPKGSADR